MPLFTAVSSSARQLFLLLRCINFTSKAQVQISADGLRFSVEDSRVMQGLAFLDKQLFTTYHYEPAPPTSSGTPSPTGEPAEDDEPPTFQISLPALLETLAIFGSTDPKDRPYRDTSTSSYTNHSSAFDTRVLGMSGLCRLHYDRAGEPLRITIEEGSVTTTCALSTYEPEAQPDIPFDREALSLKIITRAAHLHDAVAELGATSPDRLTLSASPAPNAPAPFALSAVGALGTASVAFARDPALLETFQCARRTARAYKFGLVKAAARAMAAASKVSVRVDAQGVLSLQFMIEVEGGGVSFVDFRFVPYLPEDEDEDDDEDGDGEDGGDEDEEGVR